MILSLLLRRPRNAYLDFGKDGWGRRFGVTPQVLCVCKRWLRIGSPILYETVVIKTHTGLDALARCFTDNPAVAKLVKNMQISEFGNKLPAVLASASNVQNLCLAPYVHHTQSITGIIKAANNVSKVAMSPRSLFIAKPRKGRYSFKCRTVVICMILLACEWSHIVSSRATAPTLLPLTPLLQEHIEIDNDPYLAKLFHDEGIAQGAKEVQRVGDHLTINDEKCASIVIDVLNKRLFDEQASKWQGYLASYFNEELRQKINNKRLTGRVICGAS